MDPIEQDLYNKKIDAEYEYMKYMKHKKEREFIEQTINYTWDKNHHFYKLFFTDSPSHDDCTSSDTSNVNNDAKILYRKLSVICHPDKCQEIWGENMFRTINNAHADNDLARLQRIDAYWEANHTFAQFEDVCFDKEKEITMWKKQKWYLFYYDQDFMGSVLRDLFCDNYTLKKREEKRNEEQKKWEEEQKKWNERQTKWMEEHTKWKQ